MSSVTNPFRWTEEGAAAAMDDDVKSDLVPQDSIESATEIEQADAASPREVKTSDVAPASDDGSSVAEGVGEVDDPGVVDRLGAPFDAASVSPEVTEPFEIGDTAGESGFPGTEDGSPEAPVDYQSALVGDPAPKADLVGSDPGDDVDSTLFSSPDTIEREATRQGDATPTDPRIGTEEEDISVYGPPWDPWDDPAGDPSGPPPVGPPPPEQSPDYGAEEEPVISGGCRRRHRGPRAARFLAPR